MFHILKLLFLVAVVSTQESPQECGENEKYYVCAPSCRGTCDTRNVTATFNLCLPCAPGCWCKKGLLKNKEGKCASPELCDVDKDFKELSGKKTKQYPIRQVRIAVAYIVTASLILFLFVFIVCMELEKKNKNKILSTSDPAAKIFI